MLYIIHYFNVVDSVNINLDYYRCPHLFCMSLLYLFDVIVKEEVLKVHSEKKILQQKTHQVLQLDGAGDSSSSEDEDFDDDDDDNENDDDVKEEDNDEQGEEEVRA